MYWFRTDAGPGALILLGVFCLWGLGGYLLADAAYRLERRERLLAGLALGMVLSVWLANLLAHWLAAPTAFWASVLAVPVLGLIAAYAQRGRGRTELAPSGWWALALALAMAVFFVLLGRGLGILDDRKNLSFISTIAFGDVPPGFYMNPGIDPAYHYGFQLLGGMLARLAGMYPWSAFDLTKGIAAGIAIALAALAGWRLTHRWGGGLLTAGLITLASGGRWLLLFLPQGLLRSLSARVELWGSAATSAPTLFDGLATHWSVAGGPPAPIPFAFVNGILEPFVLGSQAGPGALSLAILLLALLLLSRARNRLGWVLLIPVFACWALASEADFGLYAVGLLATAVMGAAWKPGGPWRADLRRALAVIALAGAISLFQGGTLTAMRADLLGSGATASGSAGLAGFSLRWPPAIVSAQLGELSLLDSKTLLVGLLELGPVLLAAPAAVWLTRRWLIRGRYQLAGLGVASVIGVLLPLVVRYQSDRDITRLTAEGLLGWLLLAVAAAALLLRARPAGRLMWGGLGWAAVTCFGGLVVTGSLLTAIPRAMLSSDIAPIDARMTDRFWGVLEPDSLVLDSHPWRAVALTGLPTRSSPSSLETLPEWEALVADPTLESIVEAGFRYVYVDEYWWQRNGNALAAQFSDPCVELLGMETDEGANGSRRLFDLAGCRP